MAILKRVQREEKINLQGENAIYTLLLQGDVELHYDLQDGEYRFLIIHEEGTNLHLKESGTFRNATVYFTYLDINEDQTQQESRFWVEQGGNVHISSYYLAKDKKEIEFYVVNREGHSRADINNSCVCLENSFFHLNVEGTIKKGAKEGKLYQHSRCLTVGKPESVKITPILRIDENDVEAGHGVSTGTIDEIILYYMKARGLSRSEAMVLLIRAYLLPQNLTLSEYEGAQDELMRMEKRVSKLCLMS